MATLHVKRTLIAVFIAITCSMASKKNQEQQGATKVDTVMNGPLLLNELLLDYDSFSRPSSDSEEPCNVRVTLTPSLVAWKEDQLKTAITLEHTWMDERLKFTGEKELKLSDANSRLWLPDTTFNSVESHSTTHGLITIQPHGLVRWIQQVLLTSPCPLEPSDVWTHDGIVNCTLTLSSRSYSDYELKYTWTGGSRVDPIKDTGTSQLRKLEFVGMKVEKPIQDAFNSSNHTESAPPKIDAKPELNVIFTVQTDFTKSVLRFLTKKAMRDL